MTDTVHVNSIMKETTCVTERSKTRRSFSSLSIIPEQNFTFNQETLPY